MARTDLNSFIGHGRLQDNAQMKSVANGFSKVSFSLAVNSAYTDKEGKSVDDVSFFDCDFFGKRAAALHPYLVKGKEVEISGSLRQNRWTDDAGQKHSRVVIIVRDVHLLGGTGAKKSAGPDTDSVPEDEVVPAEIPEALPVGTDADVPF